MISLTSKCDLTNHSRSVWTFQRGFGCFWPRNQVSDSYWLSIDVDESVEWVLRAGAQRVTRIHKEAFIRNVACRLAIASNEKKTRWFLECVVVWHQRVGSYSDAYTYMYTTRCLVTMLLPVAQWLTQLSHVVNILCARSIETQALNVRSLHLSMRTRTDCYECNCYKLKQSRSRDLRATRRLSDWIINLIIRLGMQYFLPWVDWNWNVIG